MRPKANLTSRKKAKFDKPFYFWKRVSQSPNGNPATDLPQRGKPLSFSDPALLLPSVQLVTIGHEMSEIQFYRSHGGQSKKYSLSFKKKNNLTSVSNFSTIISSDLQFCIILVHSIFNNDGPLKGSQSHPNGFLIAQMDHQLYWQLPI
jgi:hypothetical protein